jgi:hypothetical protein
MTRLRFCWSSRIEMVAFLMYDILYDNARLVKATLATGLYQRHLPFLVPN